ncbi:cadherin-like domain-containing protein [Acuticoccus kandeliae]|uniref:cadherin-like domain-containing protein n=1 Tax=Acuticoccus kandeliae TaxID=2073160 RepID=UPI000D3EB6FB|nr:cadherin-like domain-containing protein [Acuticoccus kandeliae]
MVAITAPILDFMTQRGSDDRVIDLSTVFSGEGLSFSIESSDPTVAGVTIEDGLLTIDFLETLGFTDLEITATDASGESVTDFVRVRVTGENAYTIAVLPDTQDYTSNPDLYDIFGNMTEWLVANADSLNIQFVTHVGDVTQRNSAENWAIAEEALRKLDGVIPYSLAPGNHDQSTDGRASDHSTSFLDSLFSPEKQAEVNSTFGGTYDQDPTSAANTYHTFDAPDGTEWLVLSLEFGAREDVLRWAGDVLEAHPDHRVIITSHSITNFASRHDPLGDPVYAEGAGYNYGMGDELANATDGETLWRELASKYPNVVMTFSGHIFGDGAETVTSYNQYGQPVHQMLVNYQNGVAREITGNGDASQGSKGGNGAIRLVTIDPEAGTISTQTYFTEFDAYLTGGRTEGELTGDYKEHQEVISGLDLGPVVPQALALAGDDLFLTAEAGEETLAVQLDAGQSLDPMGDIVEYRWLDADGHVVATGEAPLVDLAIGQHVLTLEVEDAAGQVTRDNVRVVVNGDRTLFSENFNDGGAEGWTTVRPLLAQATKFETASEAGAPALPGGDADIMTMPALEGTQGYLVQPGFDPSTGDDFESYTIMMDILVYDGQGDYFSFFQNDLSNEEDAVIFIENNDDGTGSLEILRGRHGTINYGEWHRVAFTVEKVDGETATLKKYIDGVMVGEQSVPLERMAIDGEGGFLLFADDNGESGKAHVGSVVFSDRVFTTEEIEGYGAANAAAPLTSVDERTVQFDFANGFEPSLGEATVTIVDPKGDALETLTEFGTTEELGAPALPGGDGDIMFFPAPGEKQGFAVQPASGEAEIKTYTIMMDIMVPSGQGRYLSLLQTDPDNANDGDIFIRNKNDGSGTAELGGGGYDGTFAYDEWQRVALVVEEQSDGSLTLSKYIDGALVGTRTNIDASRFTLDGEKGFYLFTDEDGEMNDAYVSSVVFSETAFSAEAIAALGGADADGILDAAPDAATTQFDLAGDLDATFGDATLDFRDESDLGLWMVKGSVHSRVGDQTGLSAPEGALYYSQDNADKTLIWNDPAALGWSDYVFDLTIRSTDDDTIGAVFYFQDESNHYRVTFDAAQNTRQLVKVEDGVETLLAEATGGYRFNDDMALRIAVVGDEITVLLDGKDVFDGPVRDATPLDGGTVGVYASNERSAIFDNLTVNAVSLTAHGEAALRTIDEDGTGAAYVDLSASSSFGPDEIRTYRWMLDGEEIARGREVSVALPAGTEGVTLEVIDAKGAVATDFVKVDVVGAEDVLFSDDFEGESLDNWTIVDEGDLGGPSDWQLADGRLYQMSDIHSKELVFEGASASDPWERGWSPLGDGANALRKGTYALYNGEEAADWAHYSVEARIETPDTNGFGVLFHYQDAENYYKLELDNESGLFHLRRMVDGYEKTLAQVPAQYEVGAPIDLRVDIVDGKIQAYVNGEALFALPIEDHALETGTFGLYSWASEGISFDDVKVVALAGTPVNTDPVAADDTGFTTAVDTALTLAAAALLANDTDADGDVLSIVSVGNAVGGAVSLDLDGNVLFTPEADFTGEATFTYEVSDGRDGTSSATVSVSVTDPYEGWTVGTDGNDLMRGRLFRADQLYGGEGTDVIRGGAFADVIDGGAGNDRLFGGLGDDVIIGGEGNDRMRGGFGADTFVFGENSGTDIILDFDPRMDRIDLCGLGFDSYEDVLDAMRATSRGITITLDEGENDTVFLDGIRLARLAEDDFLIG